MKIVTVLLIALVIIETALINELRQPPAKLGGLYGKLGTGYSLWCTSEYTCLHEVGHAVDSMNGRPSVSPEFQAAIESLAKQSWVFEWGGLRARLTVFPGILARSMLSGPIGEWGGYRELYAELYAYFHRGGEIPPELQPFFD